MTSLPHNKPGKLKSGKPDAIIEHGALLGSYIKALEDKVKVLNEWRIKTNNLIKDDAIYIITTPK